MASESDKIKLLEFLFKLEVDNAFLARFVNDQRRPDLVEEWEFEDGDLATALQNMDSKTLQGYLNPGKIVIKGWVKGPGEP